MTEESPHWGVCAVRGGRGLRRLAQFFAGYDAIIVEGKAERPVYLHVTPEKCAIASADDLWGKDTRETQELLTPGAMARRPEPPVSARPVSGSSRTPPS